MIVFSHDDRLADAARRGPGDARILEVTRGSGSSIKIDNLSDPASRYLADARAICSDDKLPEDTLRRALPNLLRLAAESAAREAFFSAQYASGQSPADVGDTWNSAAKTGHRVSLSIFGDVRPLDVWLDKRPHRKRGLGVCTSAAHVKLNGDPQEAVEDVRRLVDDIRVSRKG